jgi:hypothetical protein
MLLGRISNSSSLLGTKPLSPRNYISKQHPNMSTTVEDCNFEQVILHRKVQEDPSTPLQKPQEEIEDQRREVDPTSNRLKIIK